MIKGSFHKKTKQNVSISKFIETKICQFLFLWVSVYWFKVMWNLAHFNTAYRDMHYSNKNSEFHYVSNEKCRDTLVPLWEFQQKVIFSKKLERQTQENIEMKGIFDLIPVVDNWVHESGWFKGQIISKCPFGVFKSPKTTKTFCQDFFPSL